MNRNYRRFRLSIIIIICMITSSVSILNFLFVSNCSNFISYIIDCINLKTSIIFNSIPPINIMWFLPEQLQIIPLTIPQMLDIIVFVIIFLLLQIPIVPPIRRYVLIKEYNMTFDIDLLYTREESYTDEEFLLNIINNEKELLKIIKYCNNNSSLRKLITKNNSEIFSTEYINKTINFRFIEFINKIFSSISYIDYLNQSSSDKWLNCDSSINFYSIFKNLEEFTYYFGGNYSNFYQVIITHYKSYYNISEFFDLDFNNDYIHIILISIFYNSLFCPFYDSLDIKKIKIFENIKTPNLVLEVI
ncbi:MAG: hypothetical protein ACTSRP_15070 [Candidatus Helarchaeota archaeon]